jgi:Ca2+-binding EF-hand superfamily protein
MTVKENSRKMKQLFKSFDQDGDGELTREELKAGIKQCMALDDCHEDDLTVLMERMDKDGNGTISY